ncbi:hypothetical protein BURPS1710b_3199 [Burkholderia pseudomallei 1710b]|uniref:Uncharacterized protein n=1 Tax=Burkholderia pseudomallei (strain 1710b) TaxID=320372 RepID=Q3JPD2_BURP1|nr:hypothetical protein BURPS1710b_3199 [Burkholderia pseudomallei 1710b]
MRAGQPSRPAGGCGASERHVDDPRVHGDRVRARRLDDRRQVRRRQRGRRARHAAARHRADHLRRRQRRAALQVIPHQIERLFVVVVNRHEARIEAGHRQERVEVLAVRHLVERQLARAAFGRAVLRDIRARRVVDGHERIAAAVHDDRRLVLQIGGHAHGVDVRADAELVRGPQLAQAERAREARVRRREPVVDATRRAVEHEIDPVRRRHAVARAEQVRHRRDGGRSDGARHRVRRREAEIAEVIGDARTRVRVRIRDGDRRHRLRIPHRRLQQIGIREIAGRVQLRERVARLARRIGARHEPRRRERRAALRANRLRDAHGQRTEVRRARRGDGRRRARLQQVRERRVIGERPAERRHGRAALLDRHAGRHAHVDLRLADDDRGDPAARVLLGRRERRPAAVADRRGDRRDVARPIADAVPRAVDDRAELLVQRPVRELDRLQRHAPPVLLGVLLRMRVLVGVAVRKRAVERGERAARFARGKQARAARARRGGERAVDQRDDARADLVRAVAAALVVVRDRAAALEPPLARRGDRAVHAARARRRRRHDARIRRIEARRHLHEQRDVLAAAAVVGIREIFGAGDLALAEGVVAREVDVRPPEAPVAAVRRDVDERPVVRVDREAPQLRGARLRGIREAGPRVAAEARLAEPRGQQIVARAVVGRLAHAARNEAGQRVHLRVFVAVARAEQHTAEKRERQPRRAPRSAPDRRHGCPQSA